MRWATPLRQWIPRDWRRSPERTAHHQLRPPRQPPDERGLGEALDCHRPATLRISRTFTIAGREHHFAIEVPTDGAGVVTVADNRTLSSRLASEGRVVVFTARILGTDPATTTVVRYRLESGGRRLVAEESRRGPVSYDNLWVFTRAVAPDSG